MLRARSQLELTWHAGDLAAAALMLVGAVTAVVYGVPGVVLMLVGFGVSLTTHAVVGLVAYRRTMSHAWPDVAPIVDDDW